MLALIALAGLSILAAPPVAAQPRLATPQTVDIARNAQALEQIGAYYRAALELKKLRALAPRDADLELWLALYLARTAEWDSAAALLAALPIAPAQLESQPVSARAAYHWVREATWSNGNYDGWSWYVWRARAEVAAARGRWDEALAAQLRAAAQRSWAGKEWVMLGVCQARLGQWDDAARSFARGRLLDPTLPEGHYFAGLAEWRGGRRAAASQAFAQALGLDSMFTEAALARARLRLPGGGRPDSLPAWFLRGGSAAGLLTSPERPKLEELSQPDRPAEPVSAPAARYLEGMARPAKAPVAVVPVLVDERGRILDNEPPYMNPAQWPDSLIHATLLPLAQWRFRPATRSGAPVRMWSEAVIRFEESR